MSVLPFPVTLRSAQLSRGRLSTESPRPSLPTPFTDEPTTMKNFETFEDLQSLIDENLKGSGVHARTEPVRSITREVLPYEASGGYVVERPAWQAFLVMLQTHFPEMGEEIAPAHYFGTLPPTRVVLTQDAIDFLNVQIDFMYGKQVEVTTITVANPGDVRMGPTTEILYEVPFRPVTGLNLIVTPTVQNSLSTRDRRILKEKESWGSTLGLQGIERFIQVCVFERVQMCPSDPRTARHNSNKPKELNRTPSLLSRTFSRKEKKPDWYQIRPSIGKTSRRSNSLFS